MESQCTTIWKEFEGEVDSIIATMATGDATNSGDMEWKSTLEEVLQFEEESRSRYVALEEGNQRLQKEVARCENHIRKLQEENAEQLRETGRLKSKMMGYLKISIDKLKASEKSDKEKLRGELQTAQEKIRELEAAGEVAQGEAEVKEEELKGKDELIEDLFSMVRSLEHSYEDKSQEVEQLKEELAREKEQLRGEIQTALEKIRELEAARHDAVKDVEDKEEIKGKDVEDKEEIKGKDELIQELSGKVKSLEQVNEEKSREVEHLNEELTREKELVRGELLSVQGKILELEAAKDVAQKDAEVKAEELKGKDELVQDLSSKVTTLEQSYDEKLREVEQLKEELDREKRFHLEDNLKSNPPMVTSAPDLTTPLIGEANTSSSGSGGESITQVTAIERSGATEMGIAADNESGETSSSNSPSRVYNFRKRNSEGRAASSHPVNDSSSKTAKGLPFMMDDDDRISPTSNKRIRTTTTTTANRQQHAVDPVWRLYCICGKYCRSRDALERHIKYGLAHTPKPCLICKTKPLLSFKHHLTTKAHARNLLIYNQRQSEESTQQRFTMPQGNEDPHGLENGGSPSPIGPGDQQVRETAEEDVSTMASTWPSSSSQASPVSPELQNQPDQQTGSATASEVTPGGNPDAVGQSDFNSHDLTLEEENMVGDIAAQD